MFHRRKNVKLLGNLRGSKLRHLIKWIRRLLILKCSLTVSHSYRRKNKREEWEKCLLWNNVVFLFDDDQSHNKDDRNGIFNAHSWVWLCSAVVSLSDYSFIFFLQFDSEIKHTTHYLIQTYDKHSNTPSYKQYFHTELSISFFYNMS